MSVTLLFVSCTCAASASRSADSSLRPSSIFLFNLSSCTSMSDLSSVRKSTCSCFIMARIIIQKSCDCASMGGRGGEAGPVPWLGGCCEASAACCAILCRIWSSSMSSWVSSASMVSSNCGIRDRLVADGGAGSLVFGFRIRLRTNGGLPVVARFSLSCTVALPRLVAVVGVVVLVSALFVILSRVSVAGPRAPSSSSLHAASGV
mmetsp:Transcript_78944/g.221294  ORF Transcript_78944/g.221294 Transcript_78944/m.221294 type:complete len:205 (-) Transcript_78944:64-678(-)